MRKHPLTLLLALIFVIIQCAAHNSPEGKMDSPHDESLPEYIQITQSAHIYRSQRTDGTPSFAHSITHGVVVKQGFYTMTSPCDRCSMMQLCL